jgi:DNA mismatch repair protein MutL
MKVRELDAHLINKIAAGEVIERPASVVKELIENSLDAGSTQIEILIEGGGVQRISVSDDGAGMDREDLLVAIRRHTTSKIHTEEDLFHIKTLGFRGEALASIVEVSRAVIRSRSEEAPEATRVEIEGGQMKNIRAEGRRKGTTVDVRDLFFNTPARRKFLKSEKTELFHIVRTVKRFALAFPNVHIRLLHGGKLVLESTPARELRDVIAHLYDADLAKALLEVKSEGREIRVGGLVAPPQQARTDRNEQYIFVNGRFVRDMALQYAVAKAYEGVLEKDRHPITFLFVDIDPQMVDVNVHPKKEEVRFSNLQLVQAEVKRAVSNALLTQGMIPSLKEPRAAPGSGEWREQVPRREDQTVRSRYQETSTLDLKRELLERASHERPLPQQAESSLERERIIGQLHGTYILVQTEQGLELIDQHVAHERIFFEKYLEQLTSGRVRRQRLLIPLTLEFPVDQAELLARHLDLLEQKLGVGLERFGGGTFILRDWPESLAEELSKEMAMHTLERVLEALEHEAEVGSEELAKQMAADLACESAVVKNTPLSLPEMQSLVAQLRHLKNPYRCPHGRPIIVSYSLGELERVFGRR